jgi:hypothetical protein
MIKLKYYKSSIRFRGNRLVVCEKCKKELGFVERQAVTSRNIDIAFPEYKNKNLCKVCMKELQTISNDVLERMYLEVANQDAPNISMMPAQTKLNHLEVTGYVLYQSKNRTNTNGKVVEALRKINTYEKIKSYVIQSNLEKLAKQGYASNIDPITLMFKLTPLGEKWVEETVLPKLSVVAFIPEDINKAILWEKEETVLGQAECREFFEDKTVSLGARVGHNGFLLVTNQRLLFVCKLGMLAKEYSIIYGTPLEKIMIVSQGRFGFNDKLVILEVNNQHRDFVHPRIQSLIPIINTAIAERKKQLLTEKQKEQVKIILDFSSLKDVMVKGGLVMSAYKCPNCSGMINLPEEGKVIMCQYCGTSIKPIDIFEKIKALIT